MKFQTYLASEAVLENRISAYFDFIKGEYHLESKPGKEAKEQAAAAHKVWDREPQPATFADLALYLGFNSLKAFDDYMETGRYAGMLKWGHLQIIAFYERKLHAQSATGAVFALKRLGYDEREETKTENNPELNIMRVVVDNSGPVPANSEQEVIL